MTYEEARDKLDDVIKKLGITICLDETIETGQWESGRKIKINPKKATRYSLAHEIGHVVCSHGCCREHSEFEAHGAAKILCRLYELPLGDAEEKMDSEAGRSAHEACGRIVRWFNDNYSKRRVAVLTGITSWGNDKEEL